MRKVIGFVGALALLTVAHRLIGPTIVGLQVDTLARDGHPTHPVWYHDSTAVQVGSKLVLAWNTNRSSVEARVWSLTGSSWLGRPSRVSSVVLDCSCVDSTGSNPNRHDVPTLVADPAGRIYAMYGGGTASKTGSQTGPWFRASVKPGSVSSWGPELRLPIPGAAYDLEAVRDNRGWNHLIGQQGDNRQGAGSLVYLRIPPGTPTTPAAPEPYRVLVKGGNDPSACPWLSKPGCDIYVIGRIAVGPAIRGRPSPLYVVWGWTEKNLSNTCGNPAGFCNHGLYLARSLDGGRHWTNIDGTVGIDLAVGSIRYDDRRFAVVDGTSDVGLYKAITVTGRYPGKPLIAYQPGADTGSGVIAAASLSASAWSMTTIDASRSWNNHLVMRAYADGAIAIWSDVAQSGGHAHEIERWWRAAGSTGWSNSSLDVGPNWFLTGRPAGPSELLVWRAEAGAGDSTVRFTLAGRG